jgi:hypothetical protein
MPYMMKFDVLVAVNMKGSIVLDVIPCTKKRKIYIELEIRLPIHVICRT